MPEKKALQINRLKDLKKKLRSDRGESITEVLLSSLIISLAMIMLVSMITAAGKMVRKSKNVADTYYACKNIFEAGTDVPSSYRGDIQAEVETENLSTGTVVISGSVISGGKEYVSSGTGDGTGKHLKLKKASASYQDDAQTVEILLEGYAFE